MKRSKSIVTRNAAELAEALGLSPSDSIEIELRSDLNDKVIEVVKNRGVTHEQAAALAHTSSKTQHSHKVPTVVFGKFPTRIDNASTVTKTFHFDTQLSV